MFTVNNKTPFKSLANSIVKEEAEHRKIGKFRRRKRRREARTMQKEEKGGGRKK